VINIDSALRVVFGRPQVTERPDPAQGLPEPDLSEAERRHVARLMRINHTGEVCAQGLYQGQALTARLPEVRAKMERSAQEENDHLAWCEHRLEALGDRKSLLNPLWYLGSFAMGAAAGLAGDKWSLGFVVETERQVERHIDGHLESLPASDDRSRAILEQMREDEIRHAVAGERLGGAPLPSPVRGAMKIVAKVMTTTAYRF
jgi:ubiquinone biosynthesis monooxygenase Coq7